MTVLTREDLARIDERFKSGNSIPIERAYITSAEWKAIRKLARRVMDAPEFKMELVSDKAGQCVAARFCTRSEVGQRVALVPVPTKGE